MSSTLQQKNIEKANKAKNPFENVECLSFKNYTFISRAKCDMDPKLLKWAFKLTEKNVGPFFKELKLGWQPKAKQKDLNKNWARYLVVQDETKKPVAFAMFRFDMDYSYSVLYCYELQVDAEHRRQGLGKCLMNALEKCATYWEMEKVVLTALKNNPDAMTFFKNLGYTLDCTTPDIFEDEEYEILSKTIGSKNM